MLDVRILLRRMNVGGIKLLCLRNGGEFILTPRAEGTNEKEPVQSDRKLYGRSEERDGTEYGFRDWVRKNESRRTRRKRKPGFEKAL